MTVFIPGDKGETIPYSERGVHISLVSWNTSGNGDTGNVQQYQIITLYTATWLVKIQVISNISNTVKPVKCGWRIRKMTMVITVVSKKAIPVIV